MKTVLSKTLLFSILLIVVPSYADPISGQLIKHFSDIGDINLTMTFDSPEKPPKRIKLPSDIHVNVHVPKDSNRKWVVHAEDRRGDEPRFLDLKIEGDDKMKQNLSSFLGYLISQDSSGFRGPDPFPTGSVAVSISAEGPRGEVIARFESCEKFSGKVDVTRELANMIESFPIFSKDLKAFVNFYEKAERREQGESLKP